MCCVSPPTHLSALHIFMSEKHLEAFPVNTKERIKHFNELLYVRIKIKGLFVRLCSVSVCSCVSSHMSEWRSVPLQEVLPLSARLQRAALPVPAHADAAGPGCPRQQAAHLPHISEAGQPEIGGGSQHWAHADDANALGVHAAAIAGIPLIRW